MEENKEKQPPLCTRFELVNKKCKSWFCPECCIARGLEVRGRLIKVLATFSNIQMLTLTVDPKLFATPALAFAYLKKHRCVSELIRTLAASGFLNSRRYFCVLEFQEHTEMPHFHVLIETGFLPIGLVREAWGRFRPATAPPPEANAPAFGHVTFSMPKFANAVHAARYACKYLIKTPEYGYPSWVLKAKRGKFKRYTTSRCFWGKDKDDKPKRDLSMRAIVDRLQKRLKRKKAIKKSIESQVRDCSEEAVLLSITEKTSPDGEVIEGRRWDAAVPQGMAVALNALGIEAQDQKRIELTPEQASIVRCLKDDSRRAA